MSMKLSSRGSRPRKDMSNVVQKKAARFTIDTLVEMLSRAGKLARLEIGRHIATRL